MISHPVALRRRRGSEGRACIQNKRGREREEGGWVDGWMDVAIMVKRGREGGRCVRNRTRSKRLFESAA